MQGKQKAVIITEYKKPPVLSEVDIPQPKEGQVQIKVIASTVNPSDRIRSQGNSSYTNPLPYVGGIEGYGEIIKAGDEQNQGKVGKKVSFFAVSGCWSQYAIAQAHSVWEIPEGVPMHCAASGLVNPLTVLGFVDTYRKWNKNNSKAKGLIHTAAASALGRMLNKICQQEKIPLLNIVRRKEQVEILKKQGAEHIINTSDENWLDQYKNAIKEHGFNVLFDALGGGDITTQLIENLNPKSEALLYGKLVNEPLKINNTFGLMKGISITGFILSEYLPTLTQEEFINLHMILPGHLKGALSTNLAKKVTLEEFPACWEESEKNATEGKYCITP